MNPDQAAWRTRIDTLVTGLPLLPEAREPDQKLRAVLGPLLRRTLEAGGGPSELVATAPELCPNCDAPVSLVRSPYCSQRCRETAAFVRQFRSAISTQVVFDVDRQAHLGQKWWSLQGGGYPTRQLMIPPKTVAKVVERHGGVCAVCGKPATEVEHTGSG